MDGHALVDLVLGTAGQERIRVGSLDPVDLPSGLVLALGNVLSDLIDNASARTSAEIEISGRQRAEQYVFSVLDRQANPSAQQVDELNRSLSGHSSGADGDLSLMAEIARRSGIEVRYESADPGLAAEVVVPTPGLGSPEDPEVPVESEKGLSEDQTPFSVFAPTVEDREATERYLESVFAPLRTGRLAEPATVPMMPEEVSEYASVVSGTSLTSRVPGENFDSEDPTEATAPGERAVDIKSALSQFESGREKAEDVEGS